MKIIRVYNNYVDAHMAVGQLGANGINGFLQNENLAIMLNNAAGAIKLAVSDSDANEALNILAAFESGSLGGYISPYNEE